MKLKCDKINKTYKLKNKSVQALVDISYTFESNKFYAIMGHSGSGKSTLIQVLGLLDKADNGDVYYDDKKINDMSEKEKASIRNKKIGFVFQSFFLSPKLKAYENVMLPMYINSSINKENRKNKAITLLKDLGLDERIDHFPSELSGGEQQRVAIARALSNNPDIILADEPTGNLDVDNEKEVMEILKNLSEEGKCIIVVSHNKIVEEYADVILKMEKGKLVDK